MNSVEVQIGKRQLKLRGDANLINASADKLNKTVNLLEESGNIKGDTLYILAGLNLAENSILNKDDYENNLEHINVEINQMSSYLQNILSQS
ncbi:cell division protein ZapA [Candidatus Kapabacteria bacterium]|nr:cell division protein ZapA [Candidatus Kapabacteria bacterium]